MRPGKQVAATLQRRADRFAPLGSDPQAAQPQSCERPRPGTWRRLKACSSSIQAYGSYHLSSELYCEAPYSRRASRCGGGARIEALLADGHGAPQVRRALPFICLLAAGCSPPSTMLALPGQHANEEIGGGLIRIAAPAAGQADCDSADECEGLQASRAPR